MSVLADFVSGKFWIDHPVNGGSVEQKPKAEVINLDDRRHCKACLNLRGGFCIKQNFRPVDDIPRRCQDFKYSGGSK